MLHLMCVTSMAGESWVTLEEHDLSSCLYTETATCHRQNGALSRMKNTEYFVDSPQCKTHDMLLIIVCQRVGMVEDWCG